MARKEKVTKVIDGDTFVNIAITPPLIGFLLYFISIYIF
jgi:ribosomal protein S19